MNVLKGIALGIICFLLFLLLTIFGIAYTVHQIALSPAFVTGVINDIDFAQVARETMDRQQQKEGEGPPPELVNAIIDSLEKIQPVLKEKINIAVRQTYDYMLGKTNAPDLKKTLGDTFMNSQFVDAVLQKIDLAQIVEQVITEQTPAGGSVSSKALTNSIISTVNALQPEIKKQVAAASDPVFSYLLGKTQTIDIKGTLRKTVLSRDFMVATINAIDIKSITRDMLGAELNTQLPQGVGLTAADIDQISAAMEPAVKQGLTAAADPMADYLVGIRPGFTATVSLESALSATKAVVKQAFQRQLPPELAGATPAQIDQAFEVYWATARSSIPATFTIDASTFGTGAPDTLNDMVTSMQNGLREARDGLDQATREMADSLDQVRPAVRIAQMVYWGLIVLILLVIGAVVLINRSVRGSTRDLGITFTCYGAIEFAGVFVVRTIIGRPEFIQQMAQGDVPQAALDVITPIVQKLTQPLFTFTLACLIIGIALLVVSFTYRKKPRTVEVTQPADKS